MVASETLTKSRAADARPAPSPDATTSIGVGRASPSRELEAAMDTVQQDLLVVLKRIIARATAPMSDGGIDYDDVAEARAVIARAESLPPHGAAAQSRGRPAPDAEDAPVHTLGGGEQPQDARERGE